MGVLCINFMMRYNKMKQESSPHADPPAVSIDEAAQSLHVERRRIYDIINILEAIQVVSRKCKNTYHWHGMDRIVETFQELQLEAIDLFPEDAFNNGFRDSPNPNGESTVEEDKENQCSSKGDESRSDDDGNSNAVTKSPPMSGLALLLESAEQVLKPSTLDLNAAPLSAAKTSKKKKKKEVMKKPVTPKEKSLGRLSQKFIQLFLIGNETIALNDASDKILGKTDMPETSPDASHADIMKARNDANKMLKTKIRRLYDIANVMASIGLITKLNGGNNMSNAARNRPSFKWVYAMSAQDILDEREKRMQQTQQKH